MNLLLVARSEGELTRFARELRSADVNVAVAAVDLGGHDAARQVAAAAQAELGPVDVLVNNAATEPQIRFHVLSPARSNTSAGRPYHPAAAQPAAPARHARPRVADRQRLLDGGMSLPLHRDLRRGQGRAHRVHPRSAQRLPHAGVTATSLILGGVKDVGFSARTLPRPG